MSKKLAYEITASQFYIERSMSIAEIARRLDVSEKTLHTWKKDGDWDKKKERYLKSKYSTNQNLYELLNLVTDKALEDYKQEGIMPDQKTLYFIMNMAGKLKDLKAFEDSEVEEKINNANMQEPAKEIDSTQMLQEFIKAVKGG